MRALILPIAGAVVLLSAPLAAGQTPAATPCTGRDCVVQKWQALHQHALEQLQRGERSSDGRSPQLIGAVEAREEATRQASIIAAVDPVEPDDSTAAATVRRLAGAIKTNPEGTEAGLVIAPFALAGSDVLPGLEVTFAALKDDFTRAGTSYTWDRSPKLADIWEEPPACPVTDRELAKLEEPHDFYLNACSRVVAAVPERLAAGGGLSAEDRETYYKRVHRARIACGLALPNQPGDSPVATLSEAIVLVGQAVGTVHHAAARADGAIPPDVATLSIGLSGEASDLEVWRQPSPTACYSDDDVRGYFRRLYWKHRTLKFAVGASFELFPRKYGFSPDGSDLPNGDVKSGEARMDFSTGKSGTEFSFGAGFGRSRDKLDDDLRGYVPVSFSVARAFSLLPKKQPLLKPRQAQSSGTARELNVVDGELPPRLILGLSAAVQLAVDKRESQETSINSVKLQPHIDFLISETLSFRLGIPLKGEIVVREKKDAVAETPTTPAKPATTEKRDLQWTVPVAIVAVLKL